MQRVQRIARRDEKAFLSEQCKEIAKNNRMRKTRDLFKNIRDIKGLWHAKRCTLRDQQWYGPNRSRRYYKQVARIHRRTIQRRSS